ncbi:hypothetical protein [Psychroflexus salis]|uniref:Uncharacterized protein n=1 Tax=Psychroflexus salis TaxID=1526574 RepID=A0A916ZS44_9FLAO|nr:hypothetical protein [Psychroflexus salis]GGE11556.1 hypothetical protein GCM10010831_11220 [Psychroflexus salis]
MAQKYIYPSLISSEVETALSYYPQLKNVAITFKFKKDIKKSTMQAQPSFWSLLKSRENRSYFILISKKFKISDQEFSTKNIPSDVLIGWLGHELGHVMDYQHRGKLNLIWFGIKYLLFDKHIVEAERVADTYAVIQGMEDYILKTKNFILNHADVKQDYKRRIQKYYLSPEEIMQIVQNR